MGDVCYKISYLRGGFMKLNHTNSEWFYMGNVSFTKKYMASVLDLMRCLLWQPYINQKWRDLLPQVEWVTSNACEKGCRSSLGMLRLGVRCFRELVCKKLGDLFVFSLFFLFSRGRKQDDLQYIYKTSWMMINISSFGTVYKLVLIV